MVNKKRYHITRNTYTLDYSNTIRVIYLCGFNEKFSGAQYKAPEDYHRLCKRCEKIANG